MIDELIFLTTYAAALKLAKLGKAGRLVEEMAEGSGQGNPNVQSIMDGLKDAEVTYKLNEATGKMEPYMKQYQVNDDYKILFRRDFDGFNTHDPAGNHWNLEVQTTRGRTVYDLHVYIDEAGAIIPFTDDNIYIPKRSPFNN